MCPTYHGSHLPCLLFSYVTAVWAIYTLLLQKCRNVTTLVTTVLTFREVNKFLEKTKLLSFIPFWFVIKRILLPWFAKLCSTYSFPNRLYILPLFQAIQKDNNFSSIITKLENHLKKLTSRYCCQCRPLTVIFSTCFLLFFAQTVPESGREAEELSN